MELGLRQAIAQGAFHLHWQPIVHCLTGRLHRFEALVRWDRPGTGPVSPDTFAAVAEVLGLHRGLDLWVMRHAMAEAALWPKTIGVAINVSALWFHSDELSRHVEALLDETGLDPGRLELEVTEHAFIGDSPAAIREFSRLRALGVGLSLDDFGTGYSALSYLRTLAFTTLKLDRAFVEGLGRCSRTEVITRAVLAMGAGLGMLVCAEGVSDPGQLAILQAYGCGEAQGFLIGRPGPMTPGRMAAWMRPDRGSLFHRPDLAAKPGAACAATAQPAADKPAADKP